jgi:hypothetical protein
MEREAAERAHGAQISNRGAVLDAARDVRLAQARVRLQWSNRFREHYQRVQALAEAEEEP